MYKGVRSRDRDKDELFTEIARAGKRYPETKRVFLADADVMFQDFERLRETLERVNEAFPRLARVNTYANGSSILAKSVSELETLKSLRLNTLYMGLETGDDGLLRAVGKRESVPDMTRAAQTAMSCGLRMSVMILIGLGGRAGSARHAEKTAEAVSAMRPNILSALRFIDVPGTSMPDYYEPLTEYEAVLELKKMISLFDLDRTVFRANHSSNPIPLEGRFPRDKETLVRELDMILLSGRADKNGPGPMPLFL
jgi:radical SAM superfamily enzyme YgiQ (UPF0313 family)